MGEAQENLKLMLLELDEMTKEVANNNNGVHLHMGCGKNILKGFLNIDKYFEHRYVLQLDMYQTPFSNESIEGIYSSHSLEHLSIRKAQLALAHWAWLLKPGGKLYLAVPDLEEICRLMISDEVSEDEKWDWYLYTLFGYQTDCSIPDSDKNLNHPDDLGQYHTTGFTEKRLAKLLRDNGLKIERQYKYDGWRTPSIWTVAVKL